MINYHIQDIGTCRIRIMENHLSLSEKLAALKKEKQT